MDDVIFISLTTGVLAMVGWLITTFAALASSFEGSLLVVETS